MCSQTQLPAAKDLLQPPEQTYSVKGGVIPAPGKPGKWLCTYCHSVFTIKKSAVTHIRVVHMNERRFSCVYCHKKMAKKTTKTRHEKVCYYK